MKMFAPVVIALLLLVASVAQAQTLSWVDADAVDGFLIERAVASGGVCGGYQQIASMGAVLTYKDVAVLSPGATYCYRLRAFIGTATTPTLISDYSDPGMFTKPLTKPKLNVIVAATATRGNSGSGTVMSSPAGIDCGRSGGPCVASFDPGPVVLTATQHPSSIFGGWGGGGCEGNYHLCTVTLKVDTDVTARFIHK